MEDPIYRGLQREVVLAALNGIIGDYLEATASPLAIAMSLRPPLEQLHRGGTLLVLVHGSCMCGLHRTRNGHDHGCALAQDFGWIPAYVHYNSGRHVSANGTPGGGSGARSSRSEPRTTGRPWSAPATSSRHCLASRNTARRCAPSGASVARA